MPYVRVHESDSFENTLKRFKKHGKLFNKRVKEISEKR
jgi:ribosomal protein S21